MAVRHDERFRRVAVWKFTHGRQFQSAFKSRNARPRLHTELLATQHSSQAAKDDAAGSAASHPILHWLFAEATTCRQKGARTSGKAVALSTYNRGYRPHRQALPQSGHSCLW